MKMNLRTTDFVPASKIQIPEIYFKRIKTGLIEVDEFLGGVDDDTGGFLRGGVYILAAGAGTGKSTFCLQLTESIASKGERVAYASGEESIEQLAFTCKRLKVKNVPVAVQPDLNVLCKKMEDLDFLVIDSFQTIAVHKQMTSRKKELHCISTLCAKAKEHKCTVIALCHLTKAGVYKGSTAVLHGVDACLNLHVDEEDPTLRIFSWSKNRFGPADKEMVLTMSKTGYSFTKVKQPVIHVTDIVKPTNSFLDQFEEFKKQS